MITFKPNQHLMKQLLLPALLAFGFACNAQVDKFILSETVKVEGDYYTAEAQKMTYDPDAQITELTGNVHFVTNAIEINNADKVTFNEETKEVVGYGNLKWDMKIPITVSHNKSLTRQGMIRYKLGDDKAYLE
jgi:lipopolysaccharide assembly outer membrane protein LptD (OstA)